MIGNLTDAQKEQFLSGNPKSLTLAFEDGTTLTNEDIIQESMTLTQTITDTQNFSLGQVFSSEFRIKIFNDGTSYAGKWFSATIRVTGTSASLKIGTFKVESEKKSNDKLYKDIVAYDALHDVLNTDYAEWHNSLTFPKTLSSYLAVFANHAGLAYRIEGTLPNASMQINRTFITSTYSGADVLRCILELTGWFAHIPQTKQLLIHPIDMMDYSKWQTIPNEAVLLGGLNYEDFITKQVTSVHIRTIDGATIGRYPSMGDPGATYYIADNPLVSGKTSSELATIASNILHQINQLFFHPVTLNCVGMPWLQPGDIINCRVDREVWYYDYPIFNRVLTGINALRDAYTANGTEQFTQTISSGNITVQTTT